ncbi:YcgN family cysteine cluster protein [Acidihalobacter prosperus]
MTLKPGFWREVSLAEMNQEQWEAVCDGCGRCCLHKLQDEDTNEVYFTNVACKLLDLHSCQCVDYRNRQKQVPDCIQMTIRDLPNFDWLPQTCSYRRLAAGYDLPEWHYLVCGDINAVHKAGISAQGRCVSEKEVDDLDAHIVHWL